MKINIKKAEKSDIKSLTDLFDEFDKYNAQEEKIPYVKDPKNQEYSEYDILNSKREIYIANVDNLTVGYITFYHLEISNEVFIEDIFIMSEFRKLGIGKRLLKLPFDLANKQKANLKLEVYKWNKNAINFYQELGFEEDSLVFIKKFE